MRINDRVELYSFVNKHLNQKNDYAFFEMLEILPEKLISIRGNAMANKNIHLGYKFR